jgi:hypothetical protein
MKRIFLVFLILTGCGGSAGGEDSPAETNIETFSRNPQEIQRVQRLVSGALRTFEYTPTLDVKVNLASNDSYSNFQNYEIEVYINSDGNYDGEGTDLRLVKFRGDEIYSHPPVAENWRYYDDIDYGGNNINGNLELRITYFKGLREEERILNNEFYYYVKIRYFDPDSDTPEIAVSEDIYPDNEIYTNQMGLQTDYERDYSGLNDKADIISVEVNVDP